MILKAVQTKQVKMRWEKAENQLLYLIQLWADTFMMHEDQYPGFLKVYRTLRKEGVQFPMHDPNTRIIMGNLVSKASPMFDYIE